MLHQLNYLRVEIKTFDLGSIIGDVFSKIQEGHRHHSLHSGNGGCWDIGLILLPEVTDPIRLNPLEGF